MKLHFISICGSIMHGLAIALHQAGHQVTGSDDKLADPARSRLAQAGILPPSEGWDASRILPDLDAVILGMHAFADNPELQRAKELGLKIYSFPEFVLEHSRQKQRIVIAGSYGKTTVTSMIMHVLEGLGRKFDYLVGAQVPGFANAVRLSEDAPILLVEGDEYLASKEDPRPKFLLYHPHIALISGISWDHINVFPTWESYKEAFRQLMAALPKAGYLMYNEEDKVLHDMAKPYWEDQRLYLHGYDTPSYKIKEGQYEVSIGGEKSKVSVIGRHNMLNIAAAWSVCEQLAVEPKEFLAQISTFVGAKFRLEKRVEEANRIVYKDFAHAPIKVSATVQAIREMYPKLHFVACVELHTFSSLTPEFLPQYKNALKSADTKIVFINAETLASKRMQPISRETIQEAFGDKQILYVTDLKSLAQALQSVKAEKKVFLMMSSGEFGGLDLNGVGG